MGWLNALSEGVGSLGSWLGSDSGANVLKGAGGLANVGASIYGGINANKMADLAKEQMDLSKQSYYRNVLKEDEMQNSFDKTFGKI